MNKFIEDEMFKDADKLQNELNHRRRILKTYGRPYVETLENERKRLMKMLGIPLPEMWK